MARRSDHTRDELTELVIKTAAKIISQDGLRALTARKIATQIGYSPGSIYNVVDTLDDLIAHVNARTMSNLKARLTGIETSGDALAEIRHVLKVYMDFQTENPRLWSANIEHAAREDYTQPEFYVRELDAVLAAVEKSLAPVFKGRSTADIQRSVRILWASLQGISAISPNAKFLDAGGDTRASLAENLVVNYVRGVAAS